MNFIDLFIILIIFFSLLGGYKNGLIGEIASLAALILGIWGAIRFSGITTDLLIRYFDLKSSYMNIISFAITFIVIVILVRIVGSTVSNLVDWGMLGALNKMGGVLFGMIRAILVLSIILMVIDKIDSDIHIIPEKAKMESRMYEPIRNIAPSIFPFIDIWDNSIFPDSKKDKKTV